MQIAPATIEQLDDEALLFDQYRVFYCQQSDLYSASNFMILKNK